MGRLPDGVWLPIAKGYDFVLSNSISPPTGRVEKGPDGASVSFPSPQVPSGIQPFQ